MSIKKITSMTMASIFALSVPAGFLAAPVSAAVAGVEVSEANFPDANFRKYVAEEIDDGDGVLSKSEIKETDSIECSELGIKDLTGIEYFTSISNLRVSGNELTKLDLSKNTNLYLLDCDNNKLSSLNLKNNKKLGRLDCTNNKLSSLNLKNNKKLVSIWCYGNKITKLNISECPLIVMLYRNVKKKTYDKYVAYYKYGGKYYGEMPAYAIDKGVKTVTNTSKYTGKVKIEGELFDFIFYYKSGKIVTGWKKIGKKWYYFDKKTGSAAVLATKIGKKVYLFSESGVLAKKGWRKEYTGLDEEAYYYVKSDGSVTTGWKKIKGKWYWFNKWGEMAASCKKKIGKKTYKFNKNGVCLNP